MSKSTCTPARKAFAKRAKAHDLEEDKKKAVNEEDTVKCDRCGNDFSTNHGTEPECKACKAKGLKESPQKPKSSSKKTKTVVIRGTVQKVPADQANDFEKREREQIRKDWNQNTVDEGRCEDYPCCGHEDGDCPDSQGRFTCVGCGTRLPKNASSSICSRCQRRMADLDRDDPTGQDFENEFGGEMEENTVDMKMGPDYKKQSRQYKVQNDDQARTVEYEPEMTENGHDKEYHCPKCHGEYNEPELKKSSNRLICPKCNIMVVDSNSPPTKFGWDDNDTPMGQEYSDGADISEAGGGAVQHSSYRTVSHGNLPQNSKQRWENDID
jgi:hypothetical protein